MTTKPTPWHQRDISTLFLRLVIIGMALFVTMFAAFIFPYIIIGANIYYSPLVAVLTGIGLYGAVVPFLVALWQGMRLLNLIDTRKTFTKHAVRSLRIIKIAAVLTSLMFSFTLPFFYAGAKDEDAPGVMVIGLAITALPFAVGIFAGLMQRLLQSAIDIKKENDLTV